MDTWPLLTSLSDSLVSTIFHKHGGVHQNLLSSLNPSWYQHSTLRDPPMMPVTLLGPLRDKQPGKHSQLLIGGGPGLGTPRMWVPQRVCRIGEGGGRRQTFPQTQVRLRKDKYPPYRGEGVYGEGKGPGWKELCVSMGGAKRSSLTVNVEV